MSVSKEMVMLEAIKRVFGVRGIKALMAGGPSDGATLYATVCDQCWLGGDRSGHKDPRMVRLR